MLEKRGGGSVVAEVRIGIEEDGGGDGGGGVKKGMVRC